VCACVRVCNREREREREREYVCVGGWTCVCERMRALSLLRCVR